VPEVAAAGVEHVIPAATALSSIGRIRAASVLPYHLRGDVVGI
jgi:hypothetical protein